MPEPAEDHRLLLRNTTTKPTGGWKAKQPETGHIIEGYTWPDLLVKIRSYRESNGLALEPNFERQVHHLVCMTMSEGLRSRRCRFEGCGGAVPKNLRPWRTRTGTLKLWILAAGKTLENLFKKRSPDDLFVGKDEAERRARICAKCPENLPVASCFGCGELGRLASELLAKNPVRLSSDSVMETCDVCGCPNRIQIRYSGELLEGIRQTQGIPAEAYPVWCWKRDLTPEPADDKNLP